jgi:N6-adenosine-specific RNA methylase IME4
VREVEGAVQELAGSASYSTTSMASQVSSSAATLVDGPYLEMFARQTWPGWDHWGNQVGKYPAEEPALRLAA